jgi:hypothetical protein
MVPILPYEDVGLGEVKCFSYNSADVSGWGLNL